MTSISDLLCINRTKEKAQERPNIYDATDIILQKRIIKTYKCEWEKFMEVN